MTIPCKFLRDLALFVTLFGFVLAKTISFPLHYLGCGLLGVYWVLWVRTFFVNEIVIIYALYALWCAVTGLMVYVDKPVFYEHIRIVIQLSILLFFVFSNYRGEYNLVGFAWIWVVVGVSLVMGPYLPLNLHHKTEVLGGRYVGLATNPNILGLYINYMVMGSLYLFSKSRERTALLRFSALVIVYAFAIYFIMRTGSRKSLISLFVISAIFVFLQRKLTLKVFVPGIFLCLFLAIIWLSRDLFVDVVRDTSIIQRSDSGSLGDSAGAGAHLAHQGFKVFTEYPIFGAGMANWSFHTDLLRFRYTHNYWIEVLSCNGLIGFLILGVLYFRYLFIIRTLLGHGFSREEGVYGVLFLSMSLVYSFGYSMHDTVHHWIFIVIYVGFSERYVVSRSSSKIKKRIRENTLGVQGVKVK